MHPRTLYSWSRVSWFSPLVQQHWLEPYFRLDIYVFCWVCKVEVNNLPMNWRAFLNWLFKVIQDWMVVASLRSFGWFRKLALSSRTIRRKTKARTCGISVSSFSHNLNLCSLGLGGSLWCFLFFCSVVVFALYSVFRHLFHPLIFLNDFHLYKCYYSYTCCTGHLLYEMLAGWELTTAEPRREQLKNFKNTPVVEVCN